MARLYIYERTTELSAIEASVVMPTFNQREALQIVLESFAYQKGVQGAWELILVDDGSEDGTRQMVKDYAAPSQLMYIHCPHSGRAAARNIGISNAQGTVVIFCDSDRAVCNQFVAHHLHRHAERDDLIVIGGVWEFYFSDLASRHQALVADLENDFQQFQRLARQPVYVKTVCQMFKENGLTQYAMPWIAFFSGNVSVRAKQLRACGAFDEQFPGWGFEHFELGYRLYKGDNTFVYEPQARNYHFAHQRPAGFYEQSIQTSFTYLTHKHPTTEINLLHEFLHGRISLQEYHNRLVQEKGGNPILSDSPVYYRQLATKSRT